MEEEGQAIEQPTLEQAALSVVDIVANKEPEAEPAAEASQPETEQAETKEEAPKPATEEQTQAEIRRLRIKYNGEEIEKDEPEVIELAQKGFDYTQKTQALAKEREELQEKIKAQVEPALKQYEEKLRLYEAAVWHNLAPEIQNTDWNALARDNPAEWAQRMQRANDVKALLANVHGELQKVEQTRAQQAQAAKQKEIAEAVDYLQKNVPGWNQDIYTKVLQAGVKNGYKPEVVQNLTDPIAIKVLWKAAEYDRLIEAKPLAEKRVQSVPKVVKPGTAEKPDANAERKQEAFKRLAKTGREADAIEVAKLFV